MRRWIAPALLLMLPACASALPRPAPVNEYPIHADGGLVYDPLRREAESTGRLALYKNAPAVTGEVSLGRYRLKYAVPKRATAYDVVPVKYRMSWDEGQGTFPVAVEATAFEDESRRKGRNLHDLALPGRLELSVQYLGSITAHLKPGLRQLMKPDLTDTPKVYPPFVREPMVRSGVVEAGDLVWFKFRFKNTGDTILDPEGIGACLMYPELMKLNADGKYVHFGKPENYYIRDLQYLYPGESHDVWIHFRTEGPEETSQNFGVAPGQYRIDFKMLYKREKESNWLANMWDGYPMYVGELPITVEKDARQAPVVEPKTTWTDGNEPDKITRWIHTFQEFMTTYDCHIQEPSGRKSVDGTLYLQVAPWTKQVVLKLISTGPVSIATKAVPIAVDSDSLKIEFDPKHQTCVLRDGRRRPAIYSQMMVDMRSQAHLGPFPEKHIVDRMREMMDCGINVLCTTSMPWLYDDLYNPYKWNHHADSWKYALDVARREGMLIEGWGAYSYDRGTIEGISNWITGRSVKLDMLFNAQYVGVTNADPNLPWANAVTWLYQFHRWGDLFYQTEQGDVPFSAEDTRGWMRQDFNIRYKMGDLTIRAFQNWARRRYKTIDAANTAWGSAYKSFDEANPETGQPKGPFGHEFEYTDSKLAFHDWSPAMEDLDEFRTELRAKNYLETLAIVRREIPGATIALRTEGANVLVSGIDPESPNPHLRHIYYSQRRCAAIAEILQKSGLVKYHSDYTTIPYTPSELRKLIPMAVKQGIMPVYLPQFDNMRDIAINSKYGTEYQVHYNLPEPRKGAMMHCLTAVYPWFKAVYEGGGVPGVLWEDYCCDGFVTETQKRELRFFKSKLQQALNSPEARRSSTQVHLPSQAWRKHTKAKISYVLSPDRSPIRR